MEQEDQNIVNRDNNSLKNSLIKEVSEEQQQATMQVHNWLWSLDEHRPTFSYQDETPKKNDGSEKQTNFNEQVSTPVQNLLWTTEGESINIEKNNSSKDQANASTNCLEKLKHKKTNIDEGKINSSIRRIEEELQEKILVKEEPFCDIEPHSMEENHWSWEMEDKKAVMISKNRSSSGVDTDGKESCITRQDFEDVYNWHQETEKEYYARIGSQAFRQACKRQQETDEQRRARLDSQAVRQARKRERESEQERKNRLTAQAYRQARNRQKETEDQRRVRLNAQASRQARIRKQETEEQRKARLSAQAMRQAKNRLRKKLGSLFVVVEL